MAVNQESYYDYDVLGDVATVETVQQRINTRFDRLYHTTKEGKRVPYVCSFCDEVLVHENDVTWVTTDRLKNVTKLLQWSEILRECDRIPPLEEQYTYNDCDHVLGQEKEWLNGVALSPRGIIRKGISSRKKNEFSSCKTCTNSLLNSKITPFYSIVNFNFVGCAPDVLTCLSEVELAFITPVQGCGYVFTFTGGTQVNLKGTMSFMRVEERSIARATTQVEQMGLTEHIVILFTGKMTPQQKTKAKKKATTVRTDKILAAVDWLCGNNVKWRNVDLEMFRREFRGKLPVIIDNSSEATSENANVEQQEVFTCYLPDGALNEQHGGFTDPEEFKSFVDEMHKANFTVTMHVPFVRQFINDSKENDLLVSSNILQFPYGVGGCYERRVTRDESITTECDHEGFLRHLSRLAQPVFQEAMFQLKMYSEVSKMRLLRRSRLQFKGAHKVDDLANALNSNDVSAAIRGRRNGNRFAGTRASQTLLNAVDATARALPHTDEAAKTARSDSEALQHHFGIGSIFLTVSFDDDNSLLLQILTREEVDDDTPLCDLTDEDLARRSEKRREIRIQYPGFAATNFEILLQILCEEVVGWDIRNDRTTENPGLFGFCEAFALAIEEQGRKTLHGHMTVWIRLLNRLRWLLFFGQVKAKEAAERLLVQYYDHLTTTELMDNPQVSLSNYRRAFDHSCTMTIRQRQLPEVVDDQSLRNLRHMLGYNHEHGVFAKCPHCDKTWTYEEMVVSFVRTRCDVTDKVTVYTNEEKMEMEKILPKARLQAQIIEFQKTQDVHLEDTPVTEINAVYQCHASCHIKKACFKCQKLRGNQKRLHKCNAQCECRFRLPDCQRKTTGLRNISDKTTWYEWHGGQLQQPLLEFVPKRSKYDLFQNISCRAISESKMSCNTNVGVIVDGPVGQYQIKYTFKSNNKEETAEYKDVEDAVKRMEGTRTHEDDAREAKRKLARAAFAHNQQNVIGAPFATYLLRHGSRFYFSHQFKSVPLRELIKLAHNQAINSTARYHLDGTPYFENQALHYVCRPDEFEHYSPKRFYECLKVTFVPPPKKTGKRKRGGRAVSVDTPGKFRFKADTGYFKHPSVKYHEATDTYLCMQGVELEEEPGLIKICQWMFPDTKTFGADIRQCTENLMNSQMETYAQLVLTLFLPWRSMGDICVPGAAYPYTTKLQIVYEEEMGFPNDFDRNVFTMKNMIFLQNIQNCAYNSLRYKIGGDELQSKTNPLVLCEDGEAKECDPEDIEEEDEEDNEHTYESLLDELGDTDCLDNDPTLLPSLLNGFTLDNLRNKGKKHCGYDNKIPAPTNQLPALQVPFDAFINSGAGRRGGHETNQQLYPGERVRTSIKTTVKILFERGVSRQREKAFENNPGAQVHDANGTISSIREWGEAAMLDTLQMRAFECILAAFLLTFYDDPDYDSDELITPSERAKFRRQQKLLRRLRGKSVSAVQHEDQLVCLLHGPGGSGKTTVVGLVTVYGKEFCDLIGHPYTLRTIVITAMSGVAATLLHGETTHSALGLNRRKVTSDEIEIWADTRLVVIDEISFASERDFAKMYKHMGELMKKPFAKYGGLNVVFAGDFSQLEPPSNDPIYKNGNICSEFHDMLNCYLELDGMWRYILDPPFGHMMYRFREGEPTLADIELLNTRVVPCHDEQPNPPVNTQVATYYNCNRDAINAAVFDDYCVANADATGIVVDAVIILMDELFMKNEGGRFASVSSNKVKKYFWQTCGEDDCKMVSKCGPNRVDPTLKLYQGCPVMLTENKDVPNGQANGSRLFVKQVNVKRGENSFLLQMANGCIVRTYFASQIQTLDLVHEQKDILPREFQIEAVPHKFNCQIKVNDEKYPVIMEGKQFTVISNTATTGHKLQGCTTKGLFVNEWAYRQNWPYVVLSRVKTMKGLFFRKALVLDLEKYKMDRHMKRMIADFRHRLSVTALTEEDYISLLAEESTGAHS